MEPKNTGEQLWPARIVGSSLHPIPKRLDPKDHRADQCLAHPHCKGHDLRLQLHLSFQYADTADGNLLLSMLTMRLVPLAWWNLGTACEYRRLQPLELTIHVVSLFHEKAQYEHFA